MFAVDLSQARWRKSSRSDTGSGGNCVEVAFTGTVTAVRDSKEPDGPKLIFTPTQWRHFLTTAQRGNLD
ncbi:DUF397 domain-containing protein [Saccharopolyspora erythraea]|uniref:DUF397 domain-containing protein n=1 Tax=Saccharopolyspora erythraea TaxID=1836 RepID=UPI001BA62D81|nr:DUF397 domain-containing protein [Saccharopolyspora erythraea]QUH04633.1 DUF397 domain-containing protein [Saccharopolyspora erythraea]